MGLAGGQGGWVAGGMGAGGWVAGCLAVWWHGSWWTMEVGEGRFISTNGAPV